MTDEKSWLPIESAPDEGCILVFGGRHKSVAMVEADGSWWRSRHSGSRNPTHWMPLPAPPTSEGEET